jgi:CubicO group peptidase (beta-lactamase class C family)
MLLGVTLEAQQPADQARAAVDRAVEEGIAAGVYPAAVVVIGRHDGVIYQRGYGHFTWSPDSPVPDPDSSLFDLASLTKVVATLPAVMKLVEAGAVDLDRPVQHYLPEFRGPGKEAVTVRHLLAHTSGLRAFLPLNELTSDAEAARRRVLEEPLRWRPGSRVEYSDLNAMLLGWIVEAVSGSTLDRYVGEIHRELGMHHTMFNPPRSLWKRVVPVGVWRGTPVAGTVHDQNAARLGGVAGHAGLFGTGKDLARYARSLLAVLRGAECGLWSRSTVELFTRVAAGNRALGWELNDTTTADNSGSLLSPAAFGHTGFTGTLIWIDPPADLFVVFLTNRVYSPRIARSISKLKEIRARVTDAAVALRGALPVAARGGRGPALGADCR